MFGFQPSSSPLLIKLMEAGYILLIPFVTMNRQPLHTQRPSFMVGFLTFHFFLPSKCLFFFCLMKPGPGKQTSSASRSLKEKLADPPSQTGEADADCGDSTGQFRRSVNQMRRRSVKCQADQRANDKSLMQESIPQCTCHRG